MSKQVTTPEQQKWLKLRHGTHGRGWVPMFDPGNAAEASPAASTTPRQEHSTGHPVSKVPAVQELEESGGSRPTLLADPLHANGCRKETLGCPRIQEVHPGPGMRREFVPRGLYLGGKKCHSLLAPGKLMKAPSTTSSFVRSTSNLSTYSFDLDGQGLKEDIRNLPKSVRAFLQDSLAVDFGRHASTVKSPAVKRAVARRGLELRKCTEEELAFIERPAWAVNAGISQRVWTAAPMGLLPRSQPG